MARDKIVMVRLDDEEYAKLEYLATKLKMKLGTYLRYLLGRAK